MSGNSVEMGPWPLGLDQINGATEVSTKALRRAFNFDVLDDGVLASRRTVTQRASGAGLRSIGTTVGIVLPPPAPADPFTFSIISVNPNLAFTCPYYYYESYNTFIYTPAPPIANTSYTFQAATAGLVTNSNFPCQINSFDVSNFTTLSASVTINPLKDGAAPSAYTATYGFILTDVAGSSSPPVGADYIVSPGGTAPTTYTVTSNLSSITGIDKSRIVGIQVVLRDTWTSDGNAHNYSNTTKLNSISAAGYVAPPLLPGTGFQHLVASKLTRNVGGNDQLVIYTSESSYPDFTAALTTITVPNTANGIISTASYDYNGSTYLSTAAHGIYKTTGGLLRPGANGYTALPNTPNGKIIGIIKSRMFLMGTNADGSFTNRMYYAKATDPTAWTTTGVPPDGGFFDIDPDTNGAVTQAFVVNDQIFIFKPNATYVFSYSSDPGADGVLRKLSDTLGGWDACVYRNEPWIINATSVYRIVNNTFIDMASQLRLQFDYRSKIAIINKTLIITNGNPANYVAYAMNFNNGAWSQYGFYAGYEPDFSTKPIVVQSSAGVDCWVNWRNGYLGRWSYITNALDSGIDSLITPGGVTFTYYPAMNLLTGGNELNNSYRWARLYWWSLEGDYYFHNAEADSQQVIVNGGATINSVPRPIDGSLSFSRVVTVSARFQNLALAYNFMETVQGLGGAPLTISKTSPGMTRTRITGIRIYVALKQNVEI